MSTQPDDKSPKETKGQPGKLEIKSDTFTQVPEADSDKVKGGAMPRGERPTLNPTGSDGCCN